ncbi:hypothetical protein CHH28_06155 [Bacterioplanes sanyensis]|uniref:Uncharacterized protein n=1 Tax=Bacterioplanes sanyensis TaxID=1249553 RepID=A0A222FHQ0_9GAMM|nr:hypothetical protein CHH28_06155 [Bacterioplanes sanyensis]
MPVRNAISIHFAGRVHCNGKRNPVDRSQLSHTVCWQIEFLFVVVEIMIGEQVTIHGDEWKKEDVADAIEWANTRVWEQQHWFAPSPTWDHDHCQICWRKLFKSSDPQHGVGYFNQQNDNWLCCECFSQFVQC